MRKLAQAAALAVVMVCGAAVADGMLIVRPTPRFRPVPMAVRYHRVKVSIDGPVATTFIDQVFFNPNNRQLEGEYIFPLPEDAAIDRFSMYIDGKEMVGETLEAGKARSIYEGIVRQMKDPALLEYIGRRTFRCRVFPIPPRGEKRVTLKYSQVVKSEGGLACYVYPLNTERFSSQPIDDVSIDISIRSLTPIKSVFSPSHPNGTDVVRRSETEARVSYEEKGTRPDKDYVLYYTLNERELDCSVVCHKPPRGKGVFLALISPTFEVGRVLPKDIVFVVDTSGSMRGPKMDQAKAALKFCLRGLKEEDRFGLVPFSTEARPFWRELKEADGDAVEEALRRVDGIEARGGTNIHEALEEALKMCPGEEGRPSMIVFLTDGEPTIGVTSAPEILRKIDAANSKKARIFVFGVGTSLNTHLLDKLAEMNRGAREYVLPEEDIEVKVSKFADKVASPVLSDVEIEFGGAEVYDLVPARMPDIFRGSQIEIFGRYARGGSCAITITGRAGGERKRLVFEAAFPDEDPGNDLLPRLWAIRQVGKLLDEIRLHGESKELKDEVVRLAREYGIMTPYTSMLVLEDEARRRPPVRIFTGRLRAEAEEAAPKAADAFRGHRGAGAVNASREIEKMKKGELGAKDLAEGLGKEGGRYIKHVGSKTFYLRDGVWRDASYDGRARTRKVEYMSDEYFELLSERPKLGRYFCLGERVLVVFEGIVYEVTED